MKQFPIALILTIILLGQNAAPAQTVQSETEGYKFTLIKEYPATSVKNQFRSSTCWSYSTLSFLESELMRTGKGEFDLADMWPVRMAYAEKAAKYVRYQGTCNFGSGGAFHDVLHVWKTYGMVPEEVYPGQEIGEINPVHGELDAVTKAYADAVIKNSNGKLSPVWLKGFEGILNAYLGTPPENFTYRGTNFTPQSFAKSLGLNPDDYVEIGSYLHHPFYEKFILEVPDNWMMGEIYNVPLDDLIVIINYSLENGYTVAWGSDVSEKGFSWKNGVAVVPDETKTDLTGTEKEKWEKLTELEKNDALYSFDRPVAEKVITQEIRQSEFDNYQSTDDHGMHITGLAKDQTGKTFYKVKNSWGKGNHLYDGYFFASEAYVRLKTIDILVNKNAIPQTIRRKLGL